MLYLDSRGEHEQQLQFLCGVMWCKFCQPDAGRELMRAAQGEDPDSSALALAMLGRGLPILTTVQTSELSGNRRTCAAGELSPAVCLGYKAISDLQSRETPPRKDVRVLRLSRTYNHFAIT